MMSRIFSACCVAVLITLLSSAMQAQTPPRIRTTSNLKDANGAAVKDGIYTITFRMYYEESGGTALWTEVAPVTVKGGIYTHLLGSISPLSSINFNSKVFLGIQIGNFELSPRTELTYAPYAVASREVVCSGAVGDVKYSILEPALFAQVNGDCWVPLNGGDIQGSKLNNIIGNDNVPDISGLFIRSQEFSGGANRDPDRTSTSPIATFQDQSFQSHNHGVNDPGHSHVINDKVRKYASWGGTFGVIGDQPRTVYLDQFDSESRTINSSTTGVNVNNSGGSETRPKNLNFWAYIRIN